jgi:hypothetical protein
MRVPDSIQKALANLIPTFSVAIVTDSKKTEPAENGFSSKPDAANKKKKKKKPKKKQSSKEASPPSSASSHPVRLQIPRTKQNP